MKTNKKKNNLRILIIALNTAIKERVEQNLDKRLIFFSTTRFSDASVVMETKTGRDIDIIILQAEQDASFQEEVNDFLELLSFHQYPGMVIIISDIHDYPVKHYHACYAIKSKDIEERIPKIIANYQKG